MSRSKEPEPLTPDEEIAKNEYLYEQRFDGLMEEYFFTNDIKLLREFVRRGGDIDQYDMRDTVADLIGAAPGPNPGGATDAVNLQFYIKVEVERKTLRLKKSAQGTDLQKAPLHEQLQSLEETGKKKAIEIVAAEMYGQGRGVSYQGGRTRYKKGEELFIAKFGRVWN